MDCGRSTGSRDRIEKKGFDPFKFLERRALSEFPALAELAESIKVNIRKQINSPGCDELLQVPKHEFVLIQRDSSNRAPVFRVGQELRLRGGQRYAARRVQGGLLCGYQRSDAGWRRTAHCAPCTASFGLENDLGRLLPVSRFQTLANVLIRKHSLDVRWATAFSEFPIALGATGSAALRVPPVDCQHAA